MNASPDRFQKKRLGDFEVIRELGRGGMGIVYEARQVSLNRRVALKVLGESLGMTTRAVVRFRREAEAAAKLHHTNIVPIYATGEHEGTHFYAMELVEGPSLNFVIRHLRTSGLDGRQSPRGNEAEPDAEATQTLHFPHDSWTGVGESTASLMPAWVAQRLCPESSSTASSSGVAESSSTLTVGNDYVDTVAKMIADVADALDYAHNQGVIHRDMKPSNLLLSPDGRLKINDFGLARMLEQPGMTLTGEFMGSPLYMSPEQIAAGRVALDHRTDIYSLGATLYELLTLQPPFPGERRDQIIGQILYKEPKPPRRVNKKIPVDLETICLKALEKDPDRRFQTAGQMAEDLRRFVNRFAISAKRAGLVGRTTKWVRRRPAIAILLLLLVAAGSTAGLLAYRSHQQQTVQRIEQGQHALDQALNLAFGGQYDQMELWLERAEVLEVHPGRIRVLRGLAAVEQGKPKVAIKQLELALEQLPGSAGAHALLMRAYIDDGQIPKFLEILEIIPKLTAKTPEDRLYKAWTMWAWDPDGALPELEVLANKHPTPAVHYVIGFLRRFELQRTFNPEDIEPTLTHLSAAKTQMPGNVRAIWLHSSANLVAADIYEHLGDTRMAALHLGQSRKDVQILLTNHAEVGDAHIAAAWQALYEGRVEETISHLKDAIKLPGSFALARFSIPYLLAHQRRYREALAELELIPEGLRKTLTGVQISAYLAVELEGPAAAEAVWLDWQRANVGRGGQFTFQIYCLLGRLDDGIAAIRAHKIETPKVFFQTPFQQVLDDYVLGDVSDEKLLASSSVHQDRFNALYYLGLKRLAKGDRAGAIEHFTAIEGSANRIHNNDWPLILLQRLRENPAWPPWIPVRDGDQAKDRMGPPAVKRSNE